jgi:hypothetical protein
MFNATFGFCPSVAKATNPIFLNVLFSKLDYCSGIVIKAMCSTTCTGKRYFHTSSLPLLATTATRQTNARKCFGSPRKSSSASLFLPASHLDATGHRKAAHLSARKEQGLKCQQTSVGNREEQRRAPRVVLAIDVNTLLDRKAQVCYHRERVKRGICTV